MQRILAIGGGGFSMGEVNSPIDEYIVSMTGKTRPRICLLATPGGDFAPLIERFHRTFEALGCETSHLSFFGPVGPKGIPDHDFATRILEQDVIFVGGGNPRASTAVWREWGLDEVLCEAWDAGVILAGMSAGAMCWFENGMQVPLGGHNGLARGLGLLPGGCAVHYHNAHNLERRDSLLAGTAIQTIPFAMAIDDYAAVLYMGTEVDVVLSWKEDATAYRVQHRNGIAHETKLIAKSIATQTLESPRVEVQIDPTILSQYVGKFEMSVSHIMTISLEDDVLFTQLPGQSKFPLFAENERAFFLKVVDAQIAFDIDPDGRLSLAHHQNGRVIQGKKLEDV